MQVHRQVGGDGSWIDRLRKGKPILSAGDGLNYFQFLSSRDAGVGFAEALGRSECFGQVYNIVHPEARTWDEWHRTVAQALGVEAEIVHVPQETLTRHCTGTVPRVERKLRSHADLYRRKTRQRYTRISARNAACGERCRKHRLDG